MSLLRRNKNESDAQAVPTPPPPNKDKKGGGIVQWLKDSYNGLYKIVLEPSMPSRYTILSLVIGLIVGLIWAYIVYPTIFTGANPNRLNAASQQQWFEMVALGLHKEVYSVDSATVLFNQIDNPQAIQTALVNDPATEPLILEALRDEDVQFALGNAVGTPSPVSQSILTDILQSLVLPIVLIIAVTIAVVLLWRLLIYENLIAPIIQRIREARDPALKEKSAKEREALQNIRDQKKLLDEMKKNTVADVELGEPVTQVLKIFTKGRSYDESDEIESGDDFLGQCGSVIPEAIEPDALAIEVWLFDMFAQGDQNHKRLFVTEAALNDGMVRNELMSDPETNNPNDWVVARPGAKVLIDSEKIRLQGEMISVETGADGRFDKFQMKVTAWKKDGKSATMPVPAPMPAYNPPAPQPYTPPPPQPTFNPPAPQPYTPPPPQPTFNPLPPAPQPMQPLTPPPSPLGARPMSAYDDMDFDPPPAPPARPAGFSPSPLPNFNPAPPPPPEDDPFGNTGDFTPLPRQ
jgi:hypothetical protein